MKQLTLIPFSKDHGVTFNVSAGVLADGSCLKIEWHIEGDLTNLKLDYGPQDPEALWKNTCFEVFLKGPGRSYWEWNLSPCGPVACYEFDDYRVKTSPCPLPSNKYIRGVEKIAKRESFIFKAEIERPNDQVELKGSVTLILESETGTFSYWAVKHTQDKPDFHSPAAFYRLT